MDILKEIDNYVKNKTIIGLKYGIIGDRMTNFNVKNKTIIGLKWYLFSA